MINTIYVVKELSLFKKYCDFDFLVGLKQFKCYRTSKGDYIAVIQMFGNYDINLHKIQVIDRFNKIKIETVRIVPLRMDKHYKLYEMIN